MSFEAVRLRCGHVVILVPVDTPDGKLPRDGTWTKSRPVDGKLLCPVESTYQSITEDS